MRVLPWLLTLVVGSAFGCSNDDEGAADQTRQDMGPTQVGSDMKVSDPGADLGADMKTNAQPDADTATDVDVDAEVDAETEADAMADAESDSEADAASPVDGGADAQVDMGDAGGPPDPAENVGICQDLGGPKGGPDPVSQCLEPTGSDWNLADWQRACRDDWDHHGVWSAEPACPLALRVGRCTGVDGGFLIGASFDGPLYEGTWVYYSPEFNLVSAEDHCEWARGVWAAE